MVIHNEAISEWIAKGEVIDRYHNPGDLFDEVHLVLCNTDRPPADALQRMAGRAHVHVYNAPLPRRGLVRTLGWRPRLLRGWANSVVELAARVRPELVRCYGTGHNALAGAEVKRRLGVPLIVSLHTTPEGGGGLRERALERLGRYGLRQADLVLPVYAAIGPYLRSIGVERYEVAYNVLNPAALREKTDYALHDPVEVICVGRQLEGKSPEQIIRGVAALDAVRLTLVGDGPLHHQLRDLAGNRVVFERSLDNDEVCRRLAEADVFAAQSDYLEMSKATLEALLTGVPVVHSRRRDGQAVPELTDDLAVLVEDEPEQWRSAIGALIADDARREALGRGARAHAERWRPDATERRYLEIYERVARNSSTNRP